MTGIQIVWWIVLLGKYVIQQIQYSISHYRQSPSLLLNHLSNLSTINTIYKQQYKQAKKTWVYNNTTFSTEKKLKYVLLLSFFQLILCQPMSLFENNTIFFV